MRRELGRRATGGFDDGLHGIDVLFDAAGPWLPVDVYENIVGVVAGEHSLPVGLVPSHEVELIHAPEVADHLVVRHHRTSFWGHSSIRKPSPELLARQMHRLDLEQRPSDTGANRPPAARLPRTHQGLWVPKSLAPGRRPCMRRFARLLLARG